MNDKHDHLTEEQFQALLDAQLIGVDTAASSPADAESSRHLSVCEDCRKVFLRFEEVSRQLGSLKDPTAAQPEGKCPPETDLRELVFEDPQNVRSQEMMRHVTNCDNCTAKLREAMEDLVPELNAAEHQDLGNLRSSGAKWQASLARRLAQTPHGEVTTSQIVRQMPQRNSFRWLLAAAAILLIGFSSTGLYLFLHKPSLDQLLISAYSEKRTVELRIPGAPFTKMAVERGSATFTSPPSLLEAEIRIQRDSVRHANDPAWLAAKGRAELLNHEIDTAILDLKNTLAISPGLLSARLDLASAYSERAAAKNQPWDNAEATEILTHVLREQPRNQVAIFNLALILERQSLFHQAAEQWRNYLKLDPSGGWAEEARRNLERDESEIRKIGQQPRLLDGPEIAAAHSTDPNAVDDALDQRAEDYFREATVRWLPQAFSTQSNSPPRSELGSALQILAGVLQTRHHDTWLFDLLKHADGHTFSSGVSLLAQSVSANNTGDYAEGARTAHLATIQFVQARNPAGSLRSRLEEIYSFRLSHNASECNRLGAPLADELARTGYAWTLLQATLERQECLNMRGELGRALSLSSLTLTNAQLARYPQLYLRAVFFAADTEASLGNTADAWRRTRDGLSISWTSTYSPMRTYSFDTELDFLADRTGRVRFDEVVLAEALATLSSDPDLLLRAMANHRLAQVALAADDQGTAEKYFKQALELFAAASQTPVTANHRMEAEIGLARVEIQRKEFSSATQRLLGLQNAIRQISNQYLQIDFFQTLAEANLGLHRHQEADSALCSALYLTESALSTLHSDVDRLEWDHAAGRTYRTFVESKLQQNDALGALEFWEWYRASAIRPTVASKPLEGDFSGGCSNRQLHAVRDQLPSLSQMTVISYAVLPSGIAAWAYDDRGVQFHWISGNAATTSQLVQRFTTLCAQPTSDRKLLFQLGRALYDQLLAPLALKLATGRPVVFEPDGLLWSTPFSALVRPDSRYLSDISSISEFPGIYYRTLIRANPPFAQNDTAVAISEDLPTHFRETNLPALPSAATEVQAIAKEFPNTVILENQEATLNALSKNLPEAVIFHFAGHAVQMPEGAALLLSSRLGQPDAGSILGASAITSMHFSRLRLAVLSACATDSGGEENGLLDPGSLARAFIKGGVPHVITTRWAVESTATEETMGAFYADLLRGISAPDALRLAMMKSRAQQSTSHPYYWAAFTSFGWT